MKGSGVKRVDAIIQDVKVSRVAEIFKRRPSSLRINETDALIVRAKTADGREAARVFYLCLKADGTVDLETIASGLSRARRNRLTSFLRYYGLVNSKERRYKLKESIKSWSGRHVEALADADLIFVP